MKVKKIEIGDVIKLPKFYSDAFLEILSEGNSPEVSGCLGIVSSIRNENSCTVIPLTQDGKLEMNEYPSKMVPLRMDISKKRNNKWEVLQRANLPDIFEYEE